MAWCRTVAVMGCVYVADCLDDSETPYREQDGSGRMSMHDQIDHQNLEWMAAGGE